MYRLDYARDLKATLVSLKVWHKGNYFFGDECWADCGPNWRMRNQRMNRGIVLKINALLKSNPEFWPKKAPGLW